MEVEACLVSLHEFSKQECTNFPSKSVCRKCNKTRATPPQQKHQQQRLVPLSLPFRLSSPLTEVIVATEDVPVTPLAELLSCHRPKNWKYLVECHVKCCLPSEIRHFTQQQGGEWRYLLQLTLVDGHVSLPAWFAIHFFSTVYCLAIYLPTTEALTF